MAKVSRSPGKDTTQSSWYGGWLVPESGDQGRAGPFPLPRWGDGCWLVPGAIEAGRGVSGPHLLWGDSPVLLLSQRCSFVASMIHA